MIRGPAGLRSRGLVVAITTLAFALATRSWLLPQDWALGAGEPALQPVIGTLRFDDAKLYYYLALAFTLVAILLTWLALRGRLGRDLVAMRDNENAARALGVPVRRRKLQAFAVSGALAGLGGSLLAHSQQLLTPVTVELAMHETDAVLESRAEFERAGFDDHRLDPLDVRVRQSRVTDEVEHVALRAIRAGDGSGAG